MTEAGRTARIKAMSHNAGAPFAITKIGHVVLNCRDLEKSVRFYTEVLGFKVSDVYEEEMIPGGMVFMRFNADHHGVALIGSLPESSDNIELHHMAFAVSTLDEVFRAREHLEHHKVPIIVEGRRRAGVQSGSLGNSANFPMDFSPAPLIRRKSWPPLPRPTPPPCARSGTPRPD
jgi:catechol 2,3-dioxygenase